MRIFISRVTKSGAYRPMDWPTEWESIGSVELNERPYPRRNKEGYYKVKVQPHGSYLPRNSHLVDIYFYQADDRRLYEYFLDQSKNYDKNKYLGNFVVCNTTQHRDVSYEEGRILAESFNAPYIEVNASNGTNCEDLFL